jgi:hypothetical protein
VNPTPWWRRRLALFAVWTAEGLDLGAHRMIALAKRLAPYEMRLAIALDQLHREIALAEQPADYDREGEL